MVENRHADCQYRGCEFNHPAPATGCKLGLGYCKTYDLTHAGKLVKDCDRNGYTRTHCQAFDNGRCLAHETCGEFIERKDNKRLEPVITPHMIGVPPDQGKRFNESKRPAHLAPDDVRAEVDWNYGHGAKKYGENNWKKGQPFSESKACLKRHLAHFEAGEEIDPETGLNHLAAAITNLEMMLWHFWHTWPTRPELDDRPKKFNKTALVKPSEREPNGEEAPF